MTSDIPHLRAVESIGQHHYDDGEITGTPCGGCQQLTSPGQLISQYRGRTWWHTACAERDIKSGNTRHAWLALGHDLARSPGSYRVKETRAIVGAILGMVYDQDAEAEDEFSPAIGGQS